MLLLLPYYGVATTWSQYIKPMLLLAFLADYTRCLLFLELQQCIKPYILGTQIGIVIIFDHPSRFLFDF